MINSDRYKKYFVRTIICFLVIGNFMLIFSESIWYDEVFSLNLVEGNFSEILSGTAQDVHPPLYYLVLKLGLLIGNGLLGINVIYVAKFVSILPIFITVLVNQLCVKKWVGESIWLHSFCILAMPRIMSHAGIEIRMYSWAGLFVYLAFLFAAGILRGDGHSRNWIGITLTALAASYCHYFACIAAFFVYLGLFVWFLITRRNLKSIKTILISGGAVLVGYLPWLLVLSDQLRTVGSEYWIDRIGRSACIQIIEYPFGDNATAPDMLCFVLLITAVILALISLCRIAHDSDIQLAFYAMSILALTAITGVAVSRLFRPIFLPRYMIPTLWGFWLGVCLCTGKARKIRKSIITVCLLIGGLYSFIHLYNVENVRGQQADKLMADTEISLDIGEGNVYVTDSRHIYCVLKLYCADSDKVYLVRPGEEYESIIDIVDAKYAILLNDGSMKDEIDSSWEHLDEYKLEVYDVTAYRKE